MDSFLCFIKYRINMKEAKWAFGVCVRFSELRFNKTMAKVEKEEAQSEIDLA